MSLSSSTRYINGKHMEHQPSESMVRQWIVGPTSPKVFNDIYQKESSEDYAGAGRMKSTLINIRLKSSEINEFRVMSIIEVMKPLLSLWSSV